ncbi:MAG: hypothetical protein JWP99_624 [Devosia sp.]|nr:hypothetical protein [Devosia sp.]
MTLKSLKGLFGAYFAIASMKMLINFPYILVDPSAAHGLQDRARSLMA